MKKNNPTKTKALATAAIMVAILANAGCANMKNFFAVGERSYREPPINNPFGGYLAGAQGNRENIILRTKKGDRSVEVELPGNHGDMTDFVVPVNPAFSDGNRGPASVNDGMVDERYREKTSG